MTEIVCVVDAKCLLGEGTLWDPAAGVLWWVDIWGNAIHRYDPGTGRDEVFPTPEHVGCVAVRARGGLVISMASGFHFFDPATGRFTPIVDPEADQPDNRFNDGKTDRQGRFWSGTVFEAPGKPLQFTGSLWRLDPDLSAHRMVTGIAASNGLAFSPDSRTLYYADSQGGFVWAWDLDPATGDIDNRRVFIDFRSTGGCADGATVDAEGCYWVTLPITGLVARYDPAGRQMRTILLPTDLPTCCEFGGPDLDILYVTTATLRRPASELAHQPLAGGLFAIDVGIKGLALPPFAG